MTLAEMKAAVTEEAELFAQPDCKPVISAELHGIVDRHRRAKIHAVSTAYVYGDVVQLLTRNGHRYRCTEGGTSAATAPTFPTRDGAALTDGTVKWVEDGKNYDNVYDLRAILHDAAMAKVAKSTHLVNTSAGNARIEASQLQAQWRERARDFAPLGFA